jgi:hypothetical protein
MHLVFALNFYSWFILYMALLPVLWFLAALCLNLFHFSYGFLFSQESLVLFLLGSCFVYLILAIRRVYRDSWWAVLPRAAMLSISVLALIIFVYKPVLFFIVMHSIGE